VKKKSKRAITAEEHAKIVATEQNEEHRLYYQILWEIGAGQSDAANLTVENIDWQRRVLSFNRKKTGELCQLRIGTSLEALFRKLPHEGALFPRMIQIPDKHRSAEFYRRCHVLGIKGVSLHSYRYAWAERAKELGVPERLAQIAQGHSSTAVHRAYAKNGKAICPALDEYLSVSAGND
jgi:integrase